MTMRRLNIKMDPELHRRLKMAVASDGETTQTIMVRLIRQYVKEKEERHYATYVK